MKTYSELIEAMTVAQRLKRSRVMKQKSKLIARKREISMRKPPSPEKINKAVKRAVRNKAISIVDKAGLYKDASPGMKQSIEKKADLKVKKIGAKWEKRLKPEIKKAMKDAYRSRMGKNNPEL